MTDTTNSNSASRNHPSYTISTQYTTYQNEAIEAEVIRDIIVGFETDPDDFIVLDPSEPVAGSSYMQASPAQDGVNGIIIELRMEGENESFKHYSCQTADTGEVIRMFLDYWGLQKLPDWSDWMDITDQF